MADSWLYTLLATVPVTGFLGIDKLALRSPSTALYKAVINIFFWGAWYFYDLIQVLLDRKNISSYGFSTPFGPSGDGFRLLSGLTDSNASPKYGGWWSTLLFIAYALSCAFVSYTGLPSLIAGDTFGAFLKFGSMFAILPIFIHCFTGLLEYWKSATLEEIGAKRSYPIVQPIMMPKLFYTDNSTHYPAVNLLPEAEQTKQMDAYTSKLKIFQSNPENRSLFGFGARIATAAGTAYIKGADALVTSAETAGTVSQTVGSMAQTVGSVAQTAQVLSDALKDEVQKNPQQILQQVVPSLVAKPQTGGSLLEPSSELDGMVLGGIGLLIVSGFAVSLFRKIALPKRNESPRVIPKGDDAPPDPAGV